MIVYRLCNETEYQKIMTTKSFDDVGNICNNNSKFNNHKYLPNQKYLHFFKEYDSLFYLYLKSGTYICTYDIPDELLDKYMGIGKYLDRVFMRKLENVNEYAIPNNEILFNYLIKIEKVSISIEFEDYINENVTEQFEIVYDLNQKILSKKKT